MLPTQKAWQDALIQRHGAALQEKFSAASVAVCGLGGLGSNAAICLARAGVGSLTLIDYDRVDITNLHRQQYKAHQVGLYKTEALAENLREIAPYSRIQIVTRRMTEDNTTSLLTGSNVVCEAFDDAEAKAMLAECVLLNLPEAFLVSASGMAGIGSPNTIHTRRISKRFYLCGDEKSGVSEDVSLISARVALCAAHQALTVLRILAGEYST